jgi:hypothetical protein
MHYGAPSSGTGWTHVIAAIVVFALIGGGIVFWSTHRAKDTPRIAQLGQRAGSSHDVRSEADQPQENGRDLETTSIDPAEVNTADTSGGMVSPDQMAAARQEPLLPMVDPPAPTVEPPPPEVQPPPETGSTPPGAPKYVTGVLRQFSSNDFKKEVVEASKTYPVLFQFYSDT